MQDPALQELLDREAIRQCLATYCRGVDQLDRAALESVYHGDAIDDHGYYVGPAAGFIDWALDFHAKRQLRTQHDLGSHRCDLDGDTAHCETYWTYRAINVGDPRYSVSSGRYIDRFEKRDGRWAIVVRVCVIDIGDPATDPQGLGGSGAFAPTSRSLADPSYQRPLEVDRSRFTV